MRSIILKSGLDEILFNAICKVTNLVVWFNSWYYSWTKLYILFISQKRYKLSL